MSFRQLHPAVRPMVGPEASAELLDHALRYCGGTDGTRPGAYGMTGKATTPEHFCELDGDAYRWCARIPAGGVATCLICGIPIFIPPETCLHRVDDAPPDLEATIDRSSGRVLAV